MDSYAELVGSWTPEIPHLDEVGEWLDANRPSSFTPGIIHGDYHLGNVMYRHDAPDLAAVVDWELATIGDPLIDLGLIVAFWPEAGGSPTAVSVTPWEGFPAIDEMVARYAEGSERDLSAVHWYGVLACYKTGIILEGTHARALAGKASSTFGDLLHATTVGLFAKAAALIARS